MMHVMKNRYPLLHVALIFIALGFTCASFSAAALAQAVSSGTQQANAKPGLLNREQAAAIMPATVFYKELSATIQGRNSAGIRFADGKLVLAAMVDTSGYSSAVQQSYQAYLLNEVSLNFGGKTLAPGAYGFGFVSGDRVVVMDIAGNELMHAATTLDEHMTRPTPLQMIADPSTPGSYRLYLGRSYVTLSAAK